jgi:hypothetical protein
MSPFERRPQPSRLQRCLQVTVLLVFAFGVVAHASHRHELNHDRTHVACASCVAFGSLADAPAHPPFVAETQRISLLIAAITAGIQCRVVETVAQPRAPPYPA